MDKLKKRYRIAQLVAKKITGTLSDEESLEFEAWINDSPRNQEEFERMKKRLPQDLRAGKRLNNRIEWQAFRQKYFRNRIVRQWLFGSVAAMLIIGCFLGILLSQKPETSVPLAQNMGISTKTHKAVLILNDGRTVNISDTLTSEITVSSHANATISKGELKYEISDSSSMEDNTSPTYNTVIVPRGGEYELELSDGTRVWINSDSRLEFPVHFSGDTREVRMEGEVCFQVAKNERKPFIVKAGEIAVKVLGTLFNVEAYPDDNRITTTLAEGRVSVTDKKRQLFLEPNKQAIFENGQFQINEINASDVTSWTHGICYFSEASLEKIMDKLARWYNVEVFFADESAKNAHFSLEIERYDNVATILSKIELTGRVKFEINGRTIVVRE